ncbi:MAG: hypothetical protein QM762_00110 [Chryseolinea sp.]
MIAQIVLVPLYLTYWDVTTYGVWLAAQGIMSALSMLDMGYQTYMAYEFLRIGPKDLPLMAKSLWSALVFGIAIAFVQLIIVLVIVTSGMLPFLIGESGTANTELIEGATVALVVQGFLWLALMTIPGLIVRVLTAFGHFPRFAWWSFSYAVMSAVAPLVAVIMGGNLKAASLSLAAGALVYGILFYFALFKLLQREKVRILKPSFSLGFANFRKSLPLLGKSILENARQQGVRLIMAPLAGATGLAAFSTMRTGANVVLQGLNTIINPLVPDLMRFLHERDQERSEAAFATIWIVVVAALAPGVVILQGLFEPFFVFWTKGKIQFDPALFALLSMGVLVYAVIQPAMAVVLGNNMTQKQLLLAALAAVVLFVLLGTLVPLIGLPGAGVALMAAEITAAIGYRKYAIKWLKENGLKWPDRAYSLACVALVIAAVTITAMIWFPQFKWYTMGVSFLLFGWNGLLYIMQLPKVAVASAMNIIDKLPVVRTVVHRIIGLKRQMKSRFSHN